jgi:hypothetical protein
MRKDIKAINEAFYKIVRESLDGRTIITFADAFEEAKPWSDNAYEAIDNIERIIGGEITDDEYQEVIDFYEDGSEEAEENNFTRGSKLFFNGQQLSVGDMVTDEMGVEEGVIVGFRYPEVYVKEIDTNSGEIGEEGWSMSEENGNMGQLKWGK